MYRNTHRDQSPKDTFPRKTTNLGPKVPYLTTTIPSGNLPQLPIAPEYVWSPLLIPNPILKRHKLPFLNKSPQPPEHFRPHPPRHRRLGPHHQPHPFGTINIPSRARCHWYSGPYGIRPYVAYHIIDCGVEGAVGFLGGEARTVVMKYEEEVRVGDSEDGRVGGEGAD